MLGSWVSRVVASALLAGLALFLSLQPQGATLRIPDEKLVLRGLWTRIDMATYSSHRATFTRDPQASFSLVVADAPTVAALTFHTYNYGEGTNRLLVDVGDGAPLTVTQGPGPMGQQQIRVPLPQPRSVSVIKVQAAEIGQSALLVDHVDLDIVGFPFARLGILVALAVLVAVGYREAAGVVVTHVPSSGQSYHFIDVLRGVAVLLVVLLHARGYSELPEFPGAAWFASLATNGNLGVEIFYFISAYTLSLSLLADRQSATPISSFWVRRVARILPVFLVVVGLLVLARPYLYPDASPDVPSDVLMKYAFMTYVFQDQVVNFLLQHSVLWSVSTEFQFYILMPAFFFGAYCSLRATSRLPYVARVAAALILFVGGAWVAYLSRNILSGASWSQYSVFYHLDMFTAGMALSLVTPKYAQRLRQQPPVSQLVLGHVAPALWLVALLVLIGGTGSFVHMALPAHFDANTSFRSCLAIGLAIVIAFAHWTEARGWAVAANNPLRTVGILSFIIYLIHVPVLQIIQRFLPSSAFASAEQVYGYSVLLGLAIMLPASLLLHRAVEAPSLNLARRPGLRPALAVAAQIYLAVVAFEFFTSAALYGVK